jgi:2-polyprenyl-6-methoxyphenol hydroxylase-like FAD-dependent oxidoreductase
MTRVLIIGAGIGGSATALALHKAGFDVAVYEAHPETGEDIGAFLTLASNGMQALGQLDAAQAVAEVGFGLTSIKVLSEEGAVLTKAPLGAHEDPLTRFRCLRRARLGAALRDEVERRGIPITHGAKLADAAEDADGVTVAFTDGATAGGDLLIGADGLNSKLRSVIAPEAAGPRYAGQRVFYGYTSTIKPQCEPEEITMITGSTAAFGFAVSPDGETYWFARVPDEKPLRPTEIAATTSAQWRDLLVRLLRKDQTPAADIVAKTKQELLVTNARDLPGLDVWRTERMIVIGDAAHAASPATGQGASMAIEDAVVLAKALRDTGDAAAGLALYEELRRPRVSQNIANSARMTVSRMPDREQRAQSNQEISQRGSGPSPQVRDEELARQLDWQTPLA